MIFLVITCRCRRAKDLEAKGIHFLGMGISGGEEGARNGPSLMIGGSPVAYNALEPILSKCAAQLTSDESCVSLIGPIGAGNYVKMIHNGIEYADMQLIAEVYSVLKLTAGLTNEDLSKVRCKSVLSPLADTHFLPTAMVDIPRLEPVRARELLDRDNIYHIL